MSLLYTTIFNCILLLYYVLFVYLSFALILYIFPCNHTLIFSYLLNNFMAMVAMLYGSMIKTEIAYCFIYLFTFYISSIY